jgi:hypothetical protein
VTTVASVTGTTHRSGLERVQPHHFFQLTGAARELFGRNNLFEREAYQALFTKAERTDEIEAAESVEQSEREA